MSLTDPNAERDYDIIRNASPEVMAEVLRLLEPHRLCAQCGRPMTTGAIICALCADGLILMHHAATVRMFGRLMEAR